MELFKEIVLQVLEQSTIRVDGMQNIIESSCYKTLERIIEIVKTPDYEDEECFARIEKIVCEIEALGISCGARHSF